MNIFKRLWEKLFMSDVNEGQEVQQEEVQPEVQEVAQAEPAAEAPAGSEPATEEVKPAVAEPTDHSAIKDGLAIAGHDVEAVWSDVVAFAEASVDDFDTAAKKALEFIGHGAASAYDAVVSLVKHKS